MNWRLIVLILVSMLPHPVIAGPVMGFCVGVTPPLPDALEPNNSLAQAAPIKLSVSTFTPGFFIDGKVRLNFDNDLDEEWLSVPLRGGETYNIVFDNFGSGLPWDGGDTGPGFYYQILNEDGSMIVVPGENLDCTETDRSDRPFMPIVDGTYQLRIVQCRNEFPADVMSCIGTDASVDFEMATAAGLDTGFLTGVITDLSTGLPLVFASIITSDGDTSFSTKASGSAVEGEFQAGITAGMQLTANVLKRGYQSQAVQFDIIAPVDGMPLPAPTICNVGLTPIAQSAPIFANGFENPTAGGPAVSGDCIGI